MDYQLKPPSKTCSKTGQALQPGAVCYSALVEQHGRFLRFDYSEEGWDGPPEEAIAWWRRTVPEQPQTQSKPLDADELMQHFERLIEEASPAREKLTYVLALLLMQKRRLSIETTRDDGERRSLQLVGSHGEGPYDVREFDLSDDERQSLQNSLNAFLTEAPPTE